ncbi:unnamed protein product, partial [Bubo scandiacus]
SLKGYNRTELLLKLKKCFLLLFLRRILLILIALYFPLNTIMSLLLIKESHSRHESQDFIQKMRGLHFH